MAYTACNYIYISQFGRYYYAKPIGGTSQTITLQCQSDPLMSFKTGILNSKAVIARNSWKYDKYLHDSRLPVESRTVTGVYNFPTTTHFKGTPAPPNKAIRQFLYRNVTGQKSILQW